jgi:valyl-tRNA synthetase
MDLPKTYNPKEVEDKIYKRWEKSGFFNPDNLEKADGRFHKAKHFSMLMPPTNANGSLHAGHGLVLTIEDIITRYQRMKGKRTLWLPGLDHAGFETQVVYERELEREGRSRFQMEPRQLYDEIHSFTMSNKKNIEAQTKKIGASCDWTREKFTLDPDIIRTVYRTFKKLFNDGLLYRGRKIINWCPKHQTSLSDLETADVEQADQLYFLKYGPFTIATARPETKFGDKYVVVHPGDKRYRAFKTGQKIKLEWINGPVIATVVKDSSIDMEFGTGAMTITPWHDATDFEIAERHALEKEQIISFEGKLLPIAGEFAGLDIAAARPLVIEKLQKRGLVVKIQDGYRHTIKTCYKCGSLIEPQVREQWFVKMKPLAEPAIKAIRQGKITYIPEHYKKIMLHWLENILDWNISRQIVWGIPIPAWYCGGPQKTTQLKMGFADVVVPRLLSGMTRTYRIHDHHFKIGDRVALENSKTKLLLGHATITNIERMPIRKIPLTDPLHKSSYRSLDELLATFRRHYPPEEKISAATEAILYTYTFNPVRNTPKNDGCGQIIILGEKPKKCPACGGRNIVQETDTFDTWFSSGQWPFATLGWPDSRDFKNYYPTDVMETAGEIIFSWVARMVMLGLYVTGQVPFKTVYLHGLVLDAKGRKMSKSRGNVINPLVLTNKYGTDAFRIGLVFGNTAGTSLALSEDKIQGFKNFANKLWNIARYILSNTKNLKSEIPALSQVEGSNLKSQSLADQWILSELRDLVVAVNKNLENYQFSLACEILYDFTWKKFADWYIEISKIKNQKSNSGEILPYVMQVLLKLWHPFIPFVTEHIWSQFSKELLMVQEYPISKSKIKNQKSKIGEQFTELQELIVGLRNLRAEYRQPPAEIFAAYIETAPVWLREHLPIVEKLARVRVNFDQVPEDKKMPYFFWQKSKVYLIIPKFDAAKEAALTEKELKAVKAQIAKLKGQLSKKDFLNKAPAEVVEKIKQDFASAKSREEKLKTKIKSLK